jgi:protein-S-isoprenylcysteine O-methyltransferase Ste14
MRATDFEFRYRFWFISLIFGLAFSCYAFDHVNAAVALAKLLAGRGFDMNSLAARQRIQILFALSASLVIAAAWMRTWGSAYLRAEVVHDSALRTEQLVADGPFRYVRNPLYFGNLLLAAGVGLFTCRTGWFVLVIGQMLFLRRLIEREETVLREAQGEAYRAYLAAVPRLWPALRPHMPAGGTQPRWLQGFLGEGWMWILALDSLLFAWRLSLPLYYGVLWVSAAAYFLRWIVMRSLRRRNSARAARRESSAPPR